MAGILVIILFIYFIYYFIYLFIIYFNQLWLWTILWRPITRKICVAQKNVIEEKLLEIKRSIRRGMYLFQIRTVFFFYSYLTLFLMNILIWNLLCTLLYNQNNLSLRCPKRTFSYCCCCSWCARLENALLLLSNVLALEFWSPLMRRGSTAVSRRNSTDTYFSP